MWPNVCLRVSYPSENVNLYPDILGAKRIGLMFSSASIDMNLDPKWTKDIEDIEIGGECFSDGQLECFFFVPFAKANVKMTLCRVWFNFLATGTPTE